MSKFPTVSFENKQGHTLTGQFVCETSTHWQVAVKGIVQLVKKDEWTSVAPAPTSFDFGGLFGGVR